MDTLIHADVFFFITSIAVAIVTAFFVLAAIYAIGILRDIKYVSSLAKDHASSLSSFISSVTGIFGKFGKKGRSKKEK